MYVKTVGKIGNYNKKSVLVTPDFRMKVSTTKATGNYVVAMNV